MTEHKSIEEFDDAELIIIVYKNSSYNHDYDTYGLGGRFDGSRTTVGECIGCTAAEARILIKRLVKDNKTFQVVRNVPVSVEIAIKFEDIE